MCTYNISAINHINELKLRIFYTLLSISLTFCVAYVYSLELFYFLAKPLINLNVTDFEYSLIYTDISEAFFTYLNISIYISLFLGILLLTHHLTYFITPGLFYTEAKLLIKVKNSFYVACLISIIITYVFIIPFIWHFFISNDTSNNLIAINIHFEGKLNEYVFTLVRVFFTIICIFLTPLLLFIATKLNLVSISSLIKQRKFAFILLFILGALISPPDVVSQVLLAIPLCISYELVIFIMLINRDY
jgi:sec-independent protein translocase protein TatC